MLRTRLLAAARAVRRAHLGSHVACRPTEFAVRRIASGAYNVSAAVSKAFAAPDKNAPLCVGQNLDGVAQRSSSAGLIATRPPWILERAVDCVDLGGTLKELSIFRRGDCSIAASEVRCSPLPPSGAGGCSSGKSWVALLFGLAKPELGQLLGLACTAPGTASDWTFRAPDAS